MAFSFYFIRKDFAGTDTYYFLSHICKGTELKDQQPLTNLVFSVLPCNFAFLKILLFSLMLFSVFSISLTGNLFNKKSGWMAGLWLFLSFSFLTFFLDFEDDQFAIPLLFFSLFLFTKGLIEKKLKYKVAAVVCVLIAGLFWKNSIIWLVGLGLIWFPIIFLSFLIITFFAPGSFPGAVTSDLRVLESWPFLAFFDFNACCCLVHFGFRFELEKQYFSPAFSCNRLYLFLPNFKQTL